MSIGPYDSPVLKVATWNVNGIRARQAQVQEFIEREQPDVLCLQEIKAAFDQLPVWLCELEGYWCYWHGGKGYSGVGLHVRRSTVTEPPVFQHPVGQYYVSLPLWLLAFLCLAWPVISFLFARRRLRMRGFAVEPHSPPAAAGADPRGEEGGQKR